MKVGIAGLGLIGGSMAKAYKAAGHTVLGYDRNPVPQGYAELNQIIDGRLDTDNAGECELILVALYPQASIEYMTAIAPCLHEGVVLMDLCGIKKEVCDAGFALAAQYGFTYAGGHPMAGNRFSGIKYASATLYEGAPMVLVPGKTDDIALLARLKELLAPAKFGHLTVTTAEDHDIRIAYTSQLPHVVSNAFIKSPTAEIHRGFSAGSYRDMTRVAPLNEVMWADLFLCNREPLLAEIDCLIENLQAYRDAIAAEDLEGLTALLKSGRERWESIDGPGAEKK
ncbi:MAG: prephenate dehydrogenase/arogenate dehydrogenase family protein [Clostridia bacterium]|nr:prephenate dehydrogenase/arogenate dehydrogenase family protein [Clostridia bacterium]